MATATSNAAAFQKMLADYVTVSSMDLAEATNKKAGDVALFAARYTKAAKVGDIPGYKTGLYNALMAARPGIGSQKFQEAAAKAQKIGGGRKVKGQQNKAGAQSVLNRRKGATNYSKALWIMLAKELGKEGKGAKKAIGISKGLNKKYAEAVAAKKASVNGVTTATLLIKGAEDDHIRNILEPSLDPAMAAAARDMAPYVAKKMRERLKQVRKRRR
jgi:hypothetical protein